MIHVPGAVDLSGRWDLVDETGTYACPVTFPGDGITALHSAGLIPDPYWGRNEYDLRWISDRDWTARRMVTLDRSDVDLVIDGLDCVCTLRVNGAEVLQTRNAFRSYRVDLSSVARQGANEITITFHAATRAANDAQAAQSFPVPYAAMNCPIPNGNMLRKPACDFGWDWNIALAPFGLTGAARIEPQGAVIDRLAVAQHHSDGAVRVSVAVHTSSAIGAPFRAEFCGHVIAGTVQGAVTDLSFEIADPALWWPAGQGAQVLHDLQVTVADRVATRRIGLRRMELVTEKDAAGLSFGFRVNGRAVFAKGANWIPADALAGQITDAGTRGLLQSAVDANMNMIRVWGGGRYEADSFYDACDELGLMVWQDAMFACNLYPSAPDFLTEVDAEIRDNVARLHHHACIALWCGDNELIGALNWFEESRKDRDRYLVSYDRLNRCIETALRETDPAANWWPSSPSPGPMSFGDAWHDDGSGDMHFWSVWHEGRDFDHYRDVSPRFCSEFGFQSYPSMQVIRRFADDKDHNIAAPVFESHQKNAGGNARIAETMFRYFRWPERFADFVWLSQIQQGLAIKTAVTQWRSLKPHCMGALYWQLNDTWPVCSWSSLDHGGGWKMLHHMARDFYDPVIVTARPENGGWSLIAINDHPEEVMLTLQYGLRDVAGRGDVQTQARATVGATPVVLAHIPDAGFAPDCLLSYSWSYLGKTVAGDGRDLLTPRPWKVYDLPEPGMLLRSRDLGGGHWQIAVETAAAPAYFATVEADQPGVMTQGPRHIWPGERHIVDFRAADSAAEPAFILRDLWSATTARH